MQDGMELTVTEASDAFKNTCVNGQCINGQCVDNVNHYYTCTCDAGWIGTINSDESRKLHHNTLYYIISKLKKGFLQSMPSSCRY